MPTPNKEETIAYIINALATNNEDGTKTPPQICIRDPKGEIVPFDLGKLPVPELGILKRAINTKRPDTFEPRKDGENEIILTSDFTIYLGLTSEGCLFHNTPTKEAAGTSNSRGGRQRHSEAYEFRGDRLRY